MGLWPDEHLEALREYLSELGTTFSQVTADLNRRFETDYSRNSIIGKASREGIRSQNAPSVHGTVKPKAEPPPAKPRKRHQPTPPVEEYTLRSVEVDPRNLSLLELEPNDCRWPVTDASPHLFCGNAKFFDGCPLLPIPSRIIEAHRMEPLTPSQARFIQEAKERRLRFAASVKAAQPVVCLSVAVLAEPEIVPPVQQWVHRQVSLYQPWFNIESEIDPPLPKCPPIHVIQKVTAAYYRVTVDEIISKRRFGIIVLPRQVAVYLAKTLTGRSLPEIGRRFGGRDHATILHSFKKIQFLLQSDCELKEQVESIKVGIGEAL